MLLSIRVDFVGHSKMKRSLYRVISGLALICALFAVFLYSRHDIGIAAAKLETDIRGTSKIQADWTVDGSVSNTMAAYIAYPQERVEGYKEQAFISMNRQQAARAEIDDGNEVQVLDIDSRKPFAIVLPVNAGSITFYDINGNTVLF